MRKLGQKIANKIKSKGYRSEKKEVLKFEEAIESREFGEQLFADPEDPEEDQGWCAEESIGARVSKFSLVDGEACAWLRLDETQPDSSHRRRGPGPPNPYYLTGSRFFRECKWYGKSICPIGAPRSGPLKTDVEVQLLQASVTRNKMTVSVTVKVACLSLFR